MTHLKGFSVGILLSAAQTGRIFPSSPPRIKYLVISAFFLIRAKDGKSVLGHEKRPRGPNLAREPPYGHPWARPRVIKLPLPPGTAVKMDDIEFHSIFSIEGTPDGSLGIPMEECRSAEAGARAVVRPTCSNK